MTEDDAEGLLERHKAAFIAGDVEALMADYDKDAVMLVRGYPPLVGTAAIRQTYEAIFARIFPPQQTKVRFEPALKAGELVLLPFSAETSSLKTVAGQDAFVLKGGRIVGQFGGGDIVSTDS